MYSYTAVRVKNAVEREDGEVTVFDDEGSVIDLLVYDVSVFPNFVVPYDDVDLVHVLNDAVIEFEFDIHTNFPWVAERPLNNGLLPSFRYVI